MRKPANEVRDEWAVRLYQYLMCTSEEQAREYAEQHREHGNPEATVVRREVTTQTSEWWEGA